MATRIEVRAVFSGRGPRTIPPASRGSIIVLLMLFEMAANGTCIKMMELGRHSIRKNHGTSKGALST